MTRLPVIASLVLAYATIAAGGPLLAQTSQFTGHTELVERIQSLENELAHLRQSREFHGPSVTTIVPCDSPCCDGGCVTSCCDGYCNNDSGWYAGAEVVIVKPYFENGVQRPGDGSTFNLQGGPRVWAGLRNSAGFGVRGRYWWIDMESELPTVDSDLLSLQFKVADLEATRSVCWGPMTADFFAGARWASLVFEDLDDENVSDVEGVGMTFGADTVTALGHSNFGVVSNVRGSVMFGEATDEDGFTEGDKAFYAAELQLGLRYRRCLSGGVLTLHVLTEAQYWMAAQSSTGSIGQNNVDEDLALLGITLGGQFRY